MYKREDVQVQSCDAYGQGQLHTEETITQGGWNLQKRETQEDRVEYEGQSQDAEPCRNDKEQKNVVPHLSQQN